MVGKMGRYPCARFNQHMVAIAYQELNPVGDQRNPVLHRRNLLGDTDGKFAFPAGHFQHLFLWHQPFGRVHFAEIRAGFFHAAKFYTKLRKKNIFTIGRVTIYE